MLFRSLVFDIGGGSSELIWLDLKRLERSRRRTLHDRIDMQNCIAAWTSLPIGVVNLAERHGGRCLVQPDPAGGTRVELEFPRSS